MEIDLGGRIAALAGLAGGLRNAISGLLESNGAALSLVASGSDILRLAHLDVLVNVVLGPREVRYIEGLCRAAAERMMTPGGRILNIVSALGMIAVRGESHASASAAAILALTKALALEFGARRILVNALAVGAIDGSPLAARMISHVPLGRAGTVEEIARAALFLVDPENTYTTGHVMHVDGGWAAGYARDF